MPLPHLPPVSMTAPPSPPGSPRDTTPATSTAPVAAIALIAPDESHPILARSGQWPGRAPDAAMPYFPPELRMRIFTYFDIRDRLAFSQVSRSASADFAAFRQAASALLQLNTVRKETTWRGLLSPGNVCRAVLHGSMEHWRDSRRLPALLHAFERLPAIYPAIPPRSMHAIFRLAAGLAPAAGLELVRRVMPAAVAANPAWALLLVEHFTCRRLDMLSEAVLDALIDAVMPMWEDPRHHDSAAQALGLIAQKCKGQRVQQGHDVVLVMPGLCWMRLIEMLPSTPTPGEMPFAAGMVLSASAWDFRPSMHGIRGTSTAQLMAALEVWPVLADTDAISIHARAQRIENEDARWRRRRVG